MTGVSKSDVLHAIILREVRVRYAGRRLGYLWALFEPLMHIGAFMMIFYAMGRTVPVSESLPVFIGTGILPWLLFTNTASRAAQAINANRALLLYPHIYPVDFMLGRALLETATWFCILLTDPFILGMAA
jgi:capsular polysaccharide transport system permease protein